MNTGIGSSAFGAVFWPYRAKRQAGDDRKLSLKYAKQFVDKAYGLENVGLSQEEWIGVAGTAYELDASAAKNKLGRPANNKPHTPG